MTNNKAAWLPKPSAQMEVRDGPEAKLGEDDVLIENKAVAINPVDWKIQDNAMGLDSQFPTILGEDAAGTVIEVGSSVTKFRKGDRVLGHCISLGTGVLAQSGFQNFTVLPQIVICPIPASLSFDQAAVIPLGLSTAAAAMYSKDSLSLFYPRVGSPQPTGASILVWGGSSSVGANAIQLAVASGLEVATTCSKKNFDMVKGLGAQHIFDYSEASVVEEIVKVLRGTKFTGVVDSISHGSTLKACGAIAEQLGGGMIAATLPPQNEVDYGKKVTVKMVSSVSIFLQEEEVGTAIYQDFLPRALESGQFKAKPDPKVTGHGLKSIQDAVSALKKGVSAAKLVVTL